MLNVLAISNYRSLRNLVIPLGRLNVITGANGSGKSNVYRALRLLAETAQGRVVPSLAREGGLQSTLWAGPEVASRAVERGDYPVQGTVRQKVVSLRLGFAGDEFGYAIDLGLPAPSGSAFALDPEIKAESIWHGAMLRPSSVLTERRANVVRIRSEHGEWNVVSARLSPFKSMMTHVADPRDAPEMFTLRESIRAWRFYDHFRSDVDAPTRMAQIGTRTPVLANDGADLAAAVQTIREVGDREALDTAVEDAFPGSSVYVEDNAGWFSLMMKQHGLLRPLKAAELSDGTLRYFLLVAALLTPRPPELMVLNEPETSLHPELLAPLGRLIARAGEQSQIVVVTHSAPLIASLGEQAGCRSIQLEKKLGATVVAEAKETSAPAWHWPSR